MPASETTITNREFARDMRAAKKAASKGPVVITQRGRPSHVLLSYEEYRRLRGGGQSLADLLAHPESAHIDFDPPKYRPPRQGEPTIVDLLGMPEAEDIEFDPPKLDLKLKQVDFD